MYYEGACRRYGFVMEIIKQVKVRTEEYLEFET